MKKFMIWVVVIIVGGYGLYKYTYPTYSWKQKLTVEVETPGGVVSGSGVVEVVWRSGPKILPDPPTVSSFVYGEATVVRLPDGRLLFALLKDASVLALHVFATSKVKDTTDSRIVPASEVTAQYGKTAPVPRLVYPLLVTFGDINDPASVKKVDPDDLAASFGAGYSLKAVTLEITDEPVTKGRVEKVLVDKFFKRWGKIHKEALGRGLRDSYFDSFLSELSRGDLIRNSK